MKVCGPIYKSRDFLKRGFNKFLKIGYFIFSILNYKKNNIDGSLDNVLNVSITKQNSMHFQYLQNKIEVFDLRRSQLQTNHTIKMYL